MDGPTWAEVLELLDRYKASEGLRHERVNRTIESGLQQVTFRLDALNGRTSKSEQAIQVLQLEREAERAHIERIWRRSAMFYGGMIGLMTLIGNLIQWLK